MKQCAIVLAVLLLSTVAFAQGTTQGTTTAGGGGWFPSFPLNAPPPASSAGEARVGTLSNVFTISQNATANGLYYPPGALALRMHRMIQASGSATGLTALGDTAPLTDGSLAQVLAAGSEPTFLGILTTTTSGNIAGVLGSNNCLPGRNCWFSGYDALPSLSNLRSFIGLSNTSLNNQGGGDAQSSTYAGFMFSTDGATLNGTTFDSTHYYCIINNGGATPTIAVSNVTASAGVGHRFDVREDSAGSKWYFYIDGNAVCGSPLTTTLPTSALAEMTLVTTLTTAAAQVNLAYMEVWSDK